MSWYTVPGVDQDAVLHTQIQIFRNLCNTPFPSRMEADAAVELIDKVGGVLSGNGFHKVDFTDVSRVTAYAYAEQQYITPEFLRKSLVHALYLNEPCNLSVSLCDDDHIHIRSLMPGLSLKDAFNSAYKIEGLLDTHFDFAFDRDLGYLTQHPSCLGNAMTISVLLFLPALSLCDRIPALSRHVHDAGFCLSPLCGEDEHALGFLYRISTRSSFGLDEQTVCDHMEKAVRQIVDSERSRRKALPTELLDTLMDRALRAKGILRCAHLLSIGEYVELSSYLRLGISLGWINDVHIETLNSLLVELMPATLTLSAETQPQNVAEQDKLRAAQARERLSV